MIRRARILAIFVLGCVGCSKGEIERPRDVLAEAVQEINARTDAYLERMFGAKVTEPREPIPGALKTGTKVLVCDAGNGKKTLVSLPLHQLKTEDQGRAVLGADNLTIEDKMKVVMDRLKPFSPIRHGKYVKELQNLKTSLRFVKTDKTPLAVTADTIDVLVPSGCSLRQLSVQERIHGKSRVDIDALLWAELDLDSRVAAIVQELANTEALAEEHADTLAARKLARFFLTDLGRAEDSLARARFFRILADSGLSETIDFQLPSGDIVFLRAETARDITRVTEETAWQAACGFILTDDRAVDLCRDNRKGKISSRVKVKDGRVVGFLYDAKNPESRDGFDGTFVGIPEKLRWYVLNEGFATVIPYPVKTNTLDLWCSTDDGGRGIEYRFNDPRDTEFDPERMRFLGCKLDKTKRNTALVGGKAEDVTEVVASAGAAQGSMKERLVFKGAATLTLGDRTVLVKELVREGEKLEALVPAETVELPTVLGDTVSFLVLQPLRWDAARGGATDGVLGKFARLKFPRSRKAEAASAIVESTVPRGTRVHVAPEAKHYTVAREATLELVNERGRAELVLGQSVEIRLDRAREFTEEGRLRAGVLAATATVPVVEFEVDQNGARKIGFRGERALEANTHIRLSPETEPENAGYYLHAPVNPR